MKYKGKSIIKILKYSVSQLNQVQIVIVTNLLRHSFQTKFILRPALRSKFILRPSFQTKFILRPDWNPCYFAVLFS
ncbi:MAG: hypothetical protein DRR16_11985 [Candidatus Parabeggiatoa sp. nov. 3]|nr:MAG: hypothetical protein DRR00_05745 [Gammaproteobacteria bacterium]RKZ68033.1 MAG: hypothetical protein DRQ99_04950 [Gammaproteobacteria bacterium]RKZ85472.1 MAG: hypothetical protein DRR16_11985 [Gammaproteobacteria bacterium]